MDDAHLEQVLAEEAGHARQDVKEKYESLYNKVVNEYNTTCGYIDELENMVTSPKRNPPVQRIQDHNPKWKCESNLLPSVLEMTA